MAWPIVLIEVILVFGGVLAFAWWQLRDVRIARERAAREQAASAPTVSEQASRGASSGRPARGRAKVRPKAKRESLGRDGPG